MKTDSNLFMKREKFFRKILVLILLSIILNGSCSLFLKQSIKDYEKGNINKSKESLLKYYNINYENDKSQEYFTNSDFFMMIEKLSYIELLNDVYNNFYIDKKYNILPLYDTSNYALIKNILTLAIKFNELIILEDVKHKTIDEISKMNIIYNMTTTLISYKESEIKSLEIIITLNKYYKSQNKDIDEFKKIEDLIIETKYSFESKKDILGRQYSDNYKEIKKLNNEIIILKSSLENYYIYVKEDCSEYDCKKGKVACDECNGNGKCNNCSNGYQKCNICYGNVNIQCERCNGTGVEYTERIVTDEKTGEKRKIVNKILCLKCNGNKIIKCNNCSKGWIVCKNCNGSKKCISCSGYGYFICSKCEGEGTVTVQRLNEEGKKIDNEIHSLNYEKSLLEDENKNIDNAIERYKELINSFKTIISI